VAPLLTAAPMTARLVLASLTLCSVRANKPSQFLGRMSYTATKPGSVCPLSLSVSVVLLTRTDFYLVLFCVLCVFCLLVVLVRLSVPVQVIDWKDSSPRMTCNVLMGTLNPTHSLAHSVFSCYNTQAYILSVM